MHAFNVVHRDLKPDNILLGAQGEVRICDLGFARGIDYEGDMTEYVQHRWYRSPEVILNPRHYGTEIDIWSIGCIFAEMLGKVPLFLVNNYYQFIQLLVSYLGSPSEEDLKIVRTERAQNFIRNLQHCDKRPWSELPQFATADPMALDLMDKMLVLNPSRRYTAEQCLAHPFLVDMQENPQMEIPENANIDFSFERSEMPLDEIKTLIYNQALLFRSEQEQPKIKHIIQDNSTQHLAPSHLPQHNQIKQSLACQLPQHQPLTPIIPLHRINYQPEPHRTMVCPHSYPSNQDQNTTSLHDHIRIYYHMPQLNAAKYSYQTREI